LVLSSSTARSARHLASPARLSRRSGLSAEPIATATGNDRLGDLGATSHI
jgi:hypothetical protein